MARLIYADNAATTKLDIDAFDAMKPYLLEEYGNPSQSYSFSRKAKLALKEARETIAKCINAEPEEIYFTSCGSESNNWALNSINISNDENIITSFIEHHAILKTCAKLNKQVIYLPVDNKGRVLVEELDKHISKKTKLVTIMYANNEIGTIQKIKELTKIAHKYGAVMHTDAVQAVGHINIDVKEVGIDMLSASAHKFNGPKGVGFLYVKKGTQILSFINGGSQEFAKRAGTENVASIVGMAVALKKNCSQIKENQQKLLNFEKILFQTLQNNGIVEGIDYIRNGDLTNHIPGNISLSFRNFEGETLLHRMDLMGIAISTGSACDSVNTQLSHVLKAVEIPSEFQYGTIRISLSKYNTEEEVVTIANCLSKIVLSRI